MLHIILLILKIIGIIIEILLGILLLGVVVILFVPVRYRAEVNRKEETMPVLVKAKVTWLLHLLNVRVCYPAETEPMIRVRIACFPVFRYPGKKDAAAKQPAKEKKKEKRETKVKEEPKKTEAKKEPEKTERKPENPKTEVKKTLSEGRVTENKENIEKTEKEQSRVKQIWEAVKSLFRKLKKALENIQYTITKVCDKIKKISDNIQYYKEVIASDTFQQSYTTCKAQLGYLIRKIKPDAFRAELIIGMDDPAATAQILAVHGILYPLLGNCIALQGDFEQQRIEGQIFLRGKIRAFTFLRVFIKIYFNKEIKKLIRLLKKEAA